MRLAAEVARLEAELEAMRSRVRELEAHADRDPLTGLFNRRGFERELRRAASFVQRYGANAVLVYIDLDRFKPVNDRYGHAAGDAVLMAVAGQLSGHVRASDTVARLGGDEFGLILWNLSEQDAIAKARALELVVAGTAVTWGETEISVGASAGTATLSGRQPPEEVLAQADAAMYARKGRGVRQ
jgi:diguanylate cyclase (GGDEF)-like protein